MLGPSSSLTSPTFPVDSLWLAPQAQSRVRLGSLKWDLALPEVPATVTSRLENIMQPQASSVAGAFAAWFLRPGGDQIPLLPWTGGPLPADGLLLCMAGSKLPAVPSPRWIQPWPHWLHSRATFWGGLHVLAGMLGWWTPCWRGCTGQPRPVWPTRRPFCLSICSAVFSSQARVPGSPLGP